MGCPESLTNKRCRQTGKRTGRLWEGLKLLLPELRLAPPSPWNERPREPDPVAAAPQPVPEGTQGSWKDEWVVRGPCRGGRAHGVCRKERLASPKLIAAMIVPRTSSRYFFVEPPTHKGPWFPFLIKSNDETSLFPALLSVQRNLLNCFPFSCDY